MNFKFWKKKEKATPLIVPTPSSGIEKRNTGKGTCVWINEVGSIDYRIFDIVETKGILDKVEIYFNPNEKYTILKNYLRAGRVFIFKLPNGKIVVQNPDKWKEIDLKGQGIKILRFNLQNFSFQESKASINRWTMPEDIISKLTPWFKILIVTICIGVMAWYGLKFGGQAFTQIMGSRTMDCLQLLPQVPVPIGSNVTVPLGS